MCVREREREKKSERKKHVIDIKRKHTLVKGTTFPSIFLPRLRNYYDWTKSGAINKSMKNK